MNVNLSIANEAPQNLQSFEQVLWSLVGDKEVDVHHKGLATCTQQLSCRESHCHGLDANGHSVSVSVSLVLDLTDGHCSAHSDYPLSCALQLVLLTYLLTYTYLFTYLLTVLVLKLLSWSSVQWLKWRWTQRNGTQFLHLELLSPVWVHSHTSNYIKKTLRGPQPHVCGSKAYVGLQFLHL